MSIGYTTKSTFLGASYVVDWKITGGMGGDLEEETGVGGPRETTGVHAGVCTHAYSHGGLLVHKYSGLNLEVNI